MPPDTSIWMRKGPKVDLDLDAVKVARAARAPISRYATAESEQEIAVERAFDRATGGTESKEGVGAGSASDRAKQRADAA